MVVVEVTEQRYIDPLDRVKKKDAEANRGQFEFNQVPQIPDLNHSLIFLVFLIRPYSNAARPVSPTAVGNGTVP
jgi:hypothetical protein